MTIIVWDGENLVADRAMCCGGTMAETRKYHVIENLDTVKNIKTYTLLAGVGSISTISALMRWFREGGDREKYPRQSEDDISELIVIERGECFIYEGRPEPVLVDEGFYAAGTGMHVAYGALEMGASAIQAAQIACKRSDSCGVGIDAVNANSGERKRIYLPGWER